MTNGEKFKGVFGFGADGSRVIAVNATWWDCEYQRRSNEELSKPHWISVEERLPDSGVHVLVSCKSNGGCRYVCDAFYSAPKTEVCSYNDDIDMEYDEETDEYYMPKGWWEVIKNWDEYSCIGIEDTVTHWMPLPEPPEGEENGNI